MRDPLKTALLWVLTVGVVVCIIWLFALTNAR